MSQSILQQWEVELSCCPEDRCGMRIIRMGIAPESQSSKPTSRNTPRFFGAVIFPVDLSCTPSAANTKCKISAVTWPYLAPIYADSASSGVDVAFCDTDQGEDFKIIKP